jgi:hypothetical protein
MTDLVAVLLGSMQAHAFPGEVLNLGLGLVVLLAALASLREWQRAGESNWRRYWLLLAVMASLAGVLILLGVVIRSLAGA